MKRRFLALVAWGFWSASPAPAQPGADDYARAQRRLAANMHIPNRDVAPHWIGQDGTFWYRYERGADVEFRIARRTQAGLDVAPAFDHERVAQGLEALTGQAYSASRLPLNDWTLATARDTIAFELDGRSIVCARWVASCTYDSEAETSRAQAHKGEVLSPDGRYAAFVEEANLFVRAVGTGEVRRLTRDGTPHYGYGIVAQSHLNAISAATGRKVSWSDAYQSARVLWSPDSRSILTYRIDEREVRALPYIDSIPDGRLGAAPKLYTVRVPLPGDKVATRAELVIFDAQTGTRTDVATKPLYMAYDPIVMRRLGWAADSASVWFVREHRGFHEVSVERIAAATGQVRKVMEETATTWLAPPYTQPSALLARGGSRLFWLSDRSGWRHIQAIDTATGTTLQAVTGGPWRVDTIVRVDDRAGWIYFLARGREKGRDPYYQHFYKVRFDGRDLTLLTPENAQHDIALSPDGETFVDRVSTVGTAPVTRLRTTSDGRWLADLARADLSSLAVLGWSAPERFTVKARDGITDLYGVLYKPANFDPARSYPVLDEIYGGPQMIYAPTRFDPGPAMTQLGFVVIKFDGMGTPGRSRAFHEVSYGKGFAEGGGLIDHAGAIRQLAARHRWFDADRVGIYGHSGGGYASVRALSLFPDVFKVAVSSAGSHDQRLYQLEWGENFIGLPADDPEAWTLQANSRDVSRIRGKLLLMQGEMDDDVHPVNTMQLVEALIRANKDFDMLLFPGRNHRVDEEPYFIRRRWDYFVRNLMGAEPPDDRIEG